MIIIEHFDLSWRSGIDPHRFARQMLNLGLSAHVISNGSADVTVIVADKPITREQAQNAYENGLTDL